MSAYQPQTIHFALLLRFWRQSTLGTERAPLCGVFRGSNSSRLSSILHITDTAHQARLPARSPKTPRLPGPFLRELKMRALAVLLVLGLFVLHITSCLKICAFNIKTFGESKANNKKVMGILLKILSRYDLCLIQEVRDSKGEAVQALVEYLNRLDETVSYSYVASERLGRNSYKEQYVYIYRNNTLKVIEHYQYKPEGGGNNQTDVFSREPFIIRFYSPTTLVKDFVLIGQHTCPKNAMKEIDQLYTVFKGTQKKWEINNVVILGDLNAGCSYITVKGWQVLRLRTDPKFHWLIGDKEDTTVREKTQCAYDRIIVHGREMISCIVPGSAQAFNFREKFHLTEEEALEVSDHFPVEVDLKPNYLTHNEL